MSQDNNNKEDILLEVSHLKKYFPAGGGKQLKAVDDVSFFIKRGETFGLVGESGCDNHNKQDANSCFYCAYL